MTKTKTTAVEKSDHKPVMIIERNITDSVLNKITEFEKQGSLVLPENYAAANALKSAWFAIQWTVNKDKKPALKVCTRESIANSLLDMVVQGLNPAKHQCYFIVYGNQLTLSRSYLGTAAVTKALTNATDIFAQVIYKEDTFEFSIDPKTTFISVLKHEQSFGNVKNDEVAGAWCSIQREGAEPYQQFMTIEQVKKAWGRGQAKGNSMAHKDHPEEMAKKSVINRACKMLLDTSDDSGVLLDSVKRSLEVEYQTIDEADDEITKQIDMTAPEVIDIQTEPEPEKVKESDPIKQVLPEKEEKKKGFYDNDDDDPDLPWNK